MALPRRIGQSVLNPGGRPAPLKIKAIIRKPKAPPRPPAPRPVAAPAAAPSAFDQLLASLNTPTPKPGPAPVPDFLRQMQAQLEAERGASNAAALAAQANLGPQLTGLANQQAAMTQAAQRSYGQAAGVYNVAGAQAAPNVSSASPGGFAYDPNAYQHQANAAASPQIGAAIQAGGVARAGLDYGRVSDLSQGLLAQAAARPGQLGAAYDQKRSELNTRIAQFMQDQDAANLKAWQDTENERKAQITDLFKQQAQADAENARFNVSQANQTSRAREANATSLARSAIAAKIASGQNLTRQDIASLTQSSQTKRTVISQTAATKRTQIQQVAANRRATLAAAGKAAKAKAIQTAPAGKPKALKAGVDLARKLTNGIPSVQNGVKGYAVYSPAEIWGQVRAMGYNRAQAMRILRAAVGGAATEKFLGQIGPLP